MITLLIVGIILTPASFNADIILNEAGDAAQSLADAYNGMVDIINDLLFCVNPLIDLYNRLVSGVFSIANIIAVKAGASSPWGWASRDMHLRQQERVLDRIELRENIRAMMAETYNVPTYDEIPYSFRAKLDATIEKRINDHFREIDSEDRNVFPAALCNLITFVSDLATNIVDIVLPFIKSLVAAIIEAIDQSDGNVVDFIVVLVKFIIVELIKLIPFGYCLADIPYSILGCVCFNVSPPYPTDVPTFMGRCLFSGFCSSDTLNSANTIVEIFFKCLHLDTLQAALSTIVDFINGALDYIGNIINTIKGFISKITDIQGTLNDINHVIDIIRGALNLRREEGVWNASDDALDRVRLIIANDDADMHTFLRPAGRAGSVLWVIYKCITFYDAANNESCILNQFMVDPLLDVSFSLSEDKVSRIRAVIKEFYDDEKLAMEDIIEDLREYGHSNHGSSLITLDFAERIAAVMQHPLYLMPNATFTIQEPPEFAYIRYLASFYNKTVKVNNTPYTPFKDQPWHAEETFDKRLDAMLDANEGDTAAHQFARSVQTLIGDQETRGHINRIGLLAAHVSNVFVHLLTTDELPSMEETMLRMAGEYCNDLTENPFADNSHCHPEIYENAFQSLAILADNSRSINNISRGAEFEARMELHRTKRWQVSEHKMSARSYADFAERQEQILTKRAENAKNEVFDVEKRFIILIGIAATGVLALVGVGAIPLVAGIALLPVIIAALLPLLLIVLPLFPFILQFLMHMAIGLIGNMLNGGEYVYEDYITPFFINVGADILDLFKHQATISDIQAIATDTGNTLVTVLDSVGAYVLQQISCLIPPILGLTCAVTPPPGITTSNYFDLVIYSNIGAQCISNVGDANHNFGCTLGSICLALDPNAPHPGGKRTCTKENPCPSPMGVCRSWPLIRDGLYLSKYQINITYNVPTDPYPAEGVKYFDYASFKDYNLSWRYFFSTGFFAFQWACILCVYYGGRDVLRICINGFQIPPQVLILGSLAGSIPLMPGVLGLLRPLGFFSWTVPMRIQAVALFLMPIFVWIENSPFVWVTTVFGGPNLATWLLSFLRWPNYLDSPPFGSPTAAIYINLVRFTPFIMIGVDFLIVWGTVAFCFFFFGGLTLLYLLLKMIIWPFCYLSTSHHFMTTVMVLREKGALDAPRPPKPGAPIKFMKVGRSTIGVQGSEDENERPTVVATVMANLPQVMKPSFVKKVGTDEMNFSDHARVPASSGASQVETTNNRPNAQRRRRDMRPLREAVSFIRDDDD